MKIQTEQETALPRRRPVRKERSRSCAFSSAPAIASTAAPVRRPASAAPIPNSVSPNWCRAREKRRRPRRDKREGACGSSPAATFLPRIHEGGLYHRGPTPATEGDRTLLFRMLV